MEAEKIFKSLEVQNYPYFSRSSCINPNQKLPVVQLFPQSQTRIQIVVHEVTVIASKN